MLNKLFAIAAAALVIGLAPNLSAQTAPEFPKGVVKKASDKEKADVPALPGKVVIPPKDTSGQPPADQGLPPPEDNPDVPPAEPDETPPPENEDPPTFFGEPVSGNFVFVLDRSGSMSAVDSGSGPIEDAGGNVIQSPNRIQVVKAETIKVLTQLSEDDEFAIVSFGMSPEWAWYAERVPATAGNVQQAIADINALTANGWTPAYTALKKACTLYGTDLNKIYFLCDGSPNSDSEAPGGNGSASQILADFPGWFGPLQGEGCTLVCVHIGNSGAAGQFMQALANQSGGIYINK